MISRHRQVRAGTGETRAVIKRLLTLTLVVAAALMAVASHGVTPTHAQPAELGGPFTVINPTSGTQNTTYTVNGFNFLPFDQITIHFIDPIGNDFPFGGSLLGTSTEGTGSFQASVRPGEIITGGVSGGWIVQSCDSSGSCDILAVNITITGNNGGGASPIQGPVNPGSLPGSAPIFVTPAPAPIIIVPAPVQPARPAAAPPRPATQPSGPTTSALIGGGSISINPGTGRQTETFTILGINLRPFDQFTMSLADPFGNTIDYTADDGTPILTADSSGNFVVTIHPNIDLAGGQIVGVWGAAVCQVSTGNCVSTSFTITP